MRPSAFVNGIGTIVLAACVIILFPCAAAAQEVGGGLKAGLVLGDVPSANELVTDVTNLSTSLRNGLAAGGFIMVRWKNGFAVQPEVLYTQKGVEAAALEGVESVIVRFRTDFIDVPVLGRYTFGKGVRGYVFAGPSFDFRLNGNLKFTAIGISQEEDVSSELKTFEFALVFGGGVEFGPVLFEARWSEGLTDLNKQTTSTTEPALKTRAFLFLAGFRF